MFGIVVHILFGPVSLLRLPSAIRARRCAEPVVPFRGENTSGISLGISPFSSFSGDGQAGAITVAQ